MDKKLTDTISENCPSVYKFDVVDRETYGLLDAGKSVTWVVFDTVDPSGEIIGIKRKSQEVVRMADVDLAESDILLSDGYAKVVKAEPLDADNEDHICTFTRFRFLNVAEEHKAGVDMKAVMNEMVEVLKQLGMTMYFAEIIPYVGFRHINSLLIAKLELRS